ncbi:putative acyltransferase domain protein [Klebsiella quasipneumoniae]|uniref:Acyltransferase domain protein n=1 Tax=Klebsiella quasipneumoniae TaxID=1463165 RepID=A0ABD7MXP6_9ENTR|nr:putative acyltransferase domain protein [Klebsiella quasipneumoniae]SSG43580.1 putative acyltransferase domain protein [Klebsiella quasipneumoniae]
MLTCESVLTTDSPHFAMLDALYARAFPWHEQRESEAKLQALSHPHYALEAYLFTRTGLTASVLPGWDNLSSRCTP